MAEEAARVACKHDARKGKTLGTDCARSRENIVVDGEEVEGIEEFYIPECKGVEVAEAHGEFQGLRRA